jgi:uncharacterized protein
MEHPFCHVELQTTDPDKAKAFYTDLFQWQMSDMDMGPGGTYTVFKPEAGPGGGLMKHPVPGAPSQWMPYVGVENIKTATDKARDLGATILTNIHEVPDMGWLTVFADPTGAIIGLWQEKHK